MLVTELENEHWCYRCGHSRTDHRKMIRTATRETVWVDCLRPVGEKALPYWIHVCQCTEYRAKEEITKVNKPGE